MRVFCCEGGEWMLEQKSMMVTTMVMKMGKMRETAVGQRHQPEVG
jgi:hypothetical protein